MFSWLLQGCRALSKSEYVPIASTQFCTSSSSQRVEQRDRTSRRSVQQQTSLSLRQQSQDPLQQLNVRPCKQKQNFPRRNRSDSVLLASKAYIVPQLTKQRLHKRSSSLSDCSNDSEDLDDEWLTETYGKKSSMLASIIFQYAINQDLNEGRPPSAQIDVLPLCVSNAFLSYQNKLAFGDEDIQQERKLMKQEDSNVFKNVVVVSDVEKYYSLDEQTDAGSYGQVHIATSRDPLYKSFKVAVKIFHDEYQDIIDPYAEHQFLKEADLLAGLKHTNIVKLSGVCATPVRRAIVMEYLELNLYEYIHSGKFSLNLEQRQKITLSIADALDYLHKHSVVHGNLTPQNILLTIKDNEVQKVKVVDFGLSKLLQHTTKDRGIEVISNVYTAPELEDTYKADIYSLTVILYELWSGRIPWQGVKAPHKQAKSGKRPDIPNFVPQELKEMIGKCWQGNPSRRPSAKEVRAQLRKSLKQIKSKVSKSPIMLSPPQENYMDYYIYILTSTMELFDLRELRPSISTFNQIMDTPYGTLYEVGHNDRKVTVLKFRCDFQYQLAKEQERHFAQYADKLGQLSHPHIDNITRISIIPGERALMMDFYGYPLVEYLYKVERKEGLPLNTVVKIVKAIAKGLRYLHNNNIVHGDLHTGYVFFDKQGTPKILLFGIYELVKFFIRTGSNRHNRIEYVAPEVLQSYKRSRSADIYSLGLIMYELIANKRPWKGMSVGEIAERVCEGKRPEVPQKLQAKVVRLLWKCWAQNPESRPSAHEIVEFAKVFLGDKRMKQ